VNEMAVLITGGGGYIGDHTSLLFQEKGEDHDPETHFDSDCAASCTWTAGQSIYFWR
jgi:UDP-glucose 4-epimerase